jgi:small-conductance mechanosensitive channel
MKLNYLFSTLFLVHFAFIPVLFSQQSDTIKIDSTATLIVQNEQNLSTSHVTYKGDSLFEIRANLGPYSPQERAKIISKRLETLSEEGNINVDSFNVSDINNYSIISYKNKAILSIGEADVTPSGKTRHQVAEDYIQLLKTSFNSTKEEHSLFNLLKDIGFTILAIIGLFVIFYLQRKLFNWIDGKLIHYEKGLKRKRKSIFKYLVPNKTNNIFIVISRIVKFALSIFILFFYIPFMFSFLPWTKGFAEKFFGYISSPVKYIITQFIDFIPNLISIIVIFLIARYLLKVLAYVSNEIAEEKFRIKGFHHDWAEPTYKLVKIVIYILAAVFVVQYLPASKAFSGVSIFIGVLLTFGSTSAIANMVAGIVITYMRPFTIGDRVKIGETVGDVVEKNLLVTRLQTTKNEDITIPNATIINTQLWNYSKNASDIGIILHPTVTIGYDVPSEQVTELLLNAAKNTKNITRDFKPFVLQKSLNDFYVEYELNVYIKQPKKIPHFYSELNKSILNEFNQAGVEILSPHYSAFRDGNQSTIPQEPAPPKNPVENVIDKVTGKNK